MLRRIFSYGCEKCPHGIKNRIISPVYRQPGILPCQLILGLLEGRFSALKPVKNERFLFSGHRGTPSALTALPKGDANITGSFHNFSSYLIVDISTPYLMFS